ncbi:hypothetical protein [Paucibacter sp. KCTC 42545]|nr:hypothetical protein [Paucibacter sp. KCTC 42545]
MSDLQAPPTQRSASWLGALVACVSRAGRAGRAIASQAQAWPLLALPA